MNVFKFHKWLYGAIAGFSLVMLLASYQALQQYPTSKILLVAFIIFSSLLPTFSIFTFVHSYFSDKHTDDATKLFKQTWVKIITYIAFMLLWVGLGLYILSASMLAFFAYVFVSVGLYVGLRKLFGSAN